MDTRLNLVLHEVKRQFRSERAFYQTVGVTQRAWEKYKNGETNFKHIRLSTYQSITNTLFTRYETMLIAEAVDAVNYNWYENIIEAFHDIKVIYAKSMLESGASIEVDSGSIENGQQKRKTITKIKIVDEVDLRNINTITFQINVPPHQVPSGERNRLEWFHTNFKAVAVR
ncbi:hypothetical protein [Virgibacillus halodenitrificans]|uniref:hypothetical protein n=1 Tax=Virgibacillus halodenitrificans TaxID=1482 RepID=UPI000EF4B8AB|nr:hypothetical protein [Virgibacillus halodenitrificans]